jgi:hypothetical protein
MESANNVIVGIEDERLQPFPSTRKPSPIRTLAAAGDEEACPGSGESAIQSRKNAGLRDGRVNGLNNAG